jgi:DNA repair photolyase
MKIFNGKAIYNPSGKAGEYAEWACNFYVGCSSGCTYCYLRKGILATAMGGNTPTLKKCFKNEEHALEVFKKELQANLPELQKHGLFFSFATDPMLPETHNLTKSAVAICQGNNIPVKILTKRVEFAYNCLWTGFLYADKIAFGFTLTGHDELEPNASTNAERIKAMRKLHEAGFKTWASIEPVIDFENSKEMMHKTAAFCDLYKIGLQSGKKYDKNKLAEFMSWCTSAYENEYDPYWSIKYFKDSLLKAAGISRSELPGNCVTKDYNIFNS